MQKEQLMAAKAAVNGYAKAETNAAKGTTNGCKS